jgi:translation elongation factor EF-Ts
MLRIGCAGAAAAAQILVAACCTQGVQEVGTQLAMHIAGMKPQYVSRAAVPAAALDKERSVLRAQVRDICIHNAIAEAAFEWPAR